MIKEKNISHSLVLILTASLVLPDHYISKSIFLLLLWSVYLLYKKEVKLKVTVFSKETIPLYLITGYFILNALSLFYTNNLAEGLGKLTLRLSMVLVPILVALNYKFIKFKHVMLTFSASVCLYVLFLNISALYHIFINEEPLSNIYLTYIGLNLSSVTNYAIHPPYLGMYIVFALYSSLCYIEKKAIKTIAVSVLIWGLIIVSSKMALFSGALIGVILGFIRLISYERKWIAYLYIIVVGLTLATTYYKGEEITQNIIVKHELKNPNNLIVRVHWFLLGKDPIRRENWNSSVELITQNPITGVGVGDNIDEVQKIRNPETWSYIYQANMHNQYLEEASMFGLLGLTLFLLIFTYYFYQSIKSKNRIGLIFNVLIILSMFSESMIERNKGVVFIFFIISTLHYNSIQQKEKSLK